MFGADLEEGLRVHLRNQLHIASQNSLLDRLMGLVAQVINYPDAHRHWRRAAMDAMESNLKHEEVGAVLSTSSPVTAHVIAHELKGRYGFPWLADLRDLWSQNHNYGYGTARRKVDKWLECRTLGSADALVTVSQPWADRLKELHPAQTIRVIPNGFDPAHMNRGTEALPERFTITYTGTIYPEKQDLPKFLKAVRELIDDRSIDPRRLDLRLYTPPAPWLDVEVRNFGLDGVVSLPGIVPYEMALRLQWSSHVLLLLNWEDPLETGSYPLKLFEYLAARRPILAVGGSEADVVSVLLNETRAGWSCRDVDAVKKHLRTQYDQYQNGDVPYSGLESQIRKYSYKEMARKFAQVLDLIRADE